MCRSYFHGKSVLMLKLKESRFLCNDSDFAQWMSLTHPVFDLKMVKVFSLYQIYDCFEKQTH